MRDELTQVFDTLSDRDDVSCIVLTGAGKVFSAGADFRERPNLGDTPGAYGRHNRRVRKTHYAIVECSKPVIAAINRPAMGAGFGLVMASDIWLACEEAFVAMREINVGIAGAVAFLQQVFSRSRARRMFKCRSAWWEPASRRSCGASRLLRSSWSAAAARSKSLPQPPC